jgi:hypothetical protein
MAATPTRLARCGCGALTASARGEPQLVYLCACRACQIKSGSAFTYAAVFAADAVTIAGAHGAWRHPGDSGRWIENHFCPVCGVAVFFYSEGFAGMIGVAVGCFADDANAVRDAALTPQRMYWAERKRDCAAWTEWRRWGGSSSRLRRVPRLGHTHRQQPADRKQDNEGAEEAQHAQHIVDMGKIVEDQPDGDRQRH